MGARREDREQVVRIAAIALVGPLVALAGLVAVAVLAPWWIAIPVFLALAIGAGLALHEREQASASGMVQSPPDAPELHAVVERLCVLADLPKPKIVREWERAPNSWIEGTRRRGYRLHLTHGLLELLEPREVEAVIAHELTHVANRDAAVMTIVGGPAEALRSGGARLAEHGGPLSLGGVVALAIGWLGTLGTRALSRSRELLADAGAVALTGGAAALSSALIKVSDGLVEIPNDDLRSTGVSDVFRLLPVDDEDVGRLSATHPPLRARLEQLEQLERAL